MNTRAKVAGVAVVGAMIGMPLWSGCCEPEAKAVVYERREVRCGPNDTAFAFPTGDRGSSVVLLETDGPEQAIAGQPFSYKIKVKNLTDHMLENVVVTEQIPASLALNHSTPAFDGGAAGYEEPVRPTAYEEHREPDIARDADSSDRQARATYGESYDRAVYGRTVSWRLGRFEPNETKIIEVSATAMDRGCLTHCARVTWDQMVCISTEIVKPELRLTMSAPDFEICVDDSLALNFIVTNTGDANVHNAVIHADLPPELVLNNSGVLNVGSIAPGESREVTADVTVRQEGRYNVDAEVSAEGGVLASAGPIDVKAYRAELAISAQGPDLEHVGLPFEHTVTVTNVGDVEARDVVVEKSLPTGMHFVDMSDDDSGGVWRFASLQPQESRTVTARFRAGDQPGTIETTWVARAVCADDVSTRVATKLEGVAAMLVEVVDEHDPDKVGEEETYEIHVHNQGSAPLTNIRVNWDLPDEMDFISSSGASRADGADQASFVALPSLGPKDKAVWTVKARCRQPGELRFKVSVWSDQTGERPVEETESTRIFD